jgi:hypothetical protein
VAKLWLPPKPAACAALQITSDEPGGPEPASQEALAPGTGPAAEGQKAPGTGPAAPGQESLAPVTDPEAEGPDSPADAPGTDYQQGRLEYLQLSQKAPQRLKTNKHAQA